MWPITAAVSRRRARSNAIRPRTGASRDLLPDSALYWSFGSHKGILTVFARYRTLILLAVFLPALTGCLIRSHKVEARNVSAPAKSATLEELVARINSEGA